MYAHDLHLPLTIQRHLDNIERGGSANNSRVLLAAAQHRIQENRARIEQTTHDVIRERRQAEVDKLTPLVEALRPLAAAEPMPTERNQYPGTCVVTGESVEAGAGYYLDGELVAANVFEEVA